MNTEHHFFRYPVWYQQQNGFLIFSCPDLHITVATDLPYANRFDAKYALKLAKAMGTMELKIRETVKARRKSKIKVPRPSSVRGYLKTKKNKRLTAPVVAQLLNTSPNTVRRLADSGQLPCFVSKKGTRYFKENDVLDFVETNFLSNTN